MLLKHIQPVRPHPIKAKQVGIPYAEIMKRGSWNGANTFTKHYDTHIFNKGDLVDFDFVTPIVSKFKDD